MGLEGPHLLEAAAVGGGAGRIEAGQALLVSSDRSIRARTSGWTPNANQAPESCFWKRWKTRAAATTRASNVRRVTRRFKVGARARGSAGT